MIRQRQERARGLLQRASNALTRELDLLSEGRDTFIRDHMQVREETLAALNGYQAFKHGEVFEPALRSDDPELRDTAIIIKAGCIHAAESYRMHITRWSVDRMADEWTDYRIAARLAGQQLRRTLDSQFGEVLELIAWQSAEDAGSRNE